MLFILNTEADWKSERLWFSIGAPMSILLEKFFSIKDYGADVQEFYSIVPIRPPAPEPLNPKDLNRYSRKLKRLIVVRCADYDIFVKASPKDFQRLLAEKVLTTIDEMDKMRFKLCDFNKEQFYNDARSFMISQGWV